MIEKIEHDANPDLIDLGFLLLDINGDTIDQLDQGLKDVAYRTRLDGRSHDFTLGFNNGDSGLTIHCSRVPAREAVEALADHCRRRKYVHRAGGWFGFVVRETDSLPKLSIALRFPWKRDAKLDALTRGMVVAGSQATTRPAPTRRAPDGTKIGRNDSYACGSGKKIKKCCLT